MQKYIDGQRVIVCDACGAVHTPEPRNAGTPEHPFMIDTYPTICRDCNADLK